MDIGITMPTHGLLTRTEQDFFLQRLEPDQVQPFEFARHAEQLGYHSLWFSDHVVMGADLDMYYPANQSGKKAYPQRPTMFDAVVVMGGLAEVTSTIKFAPSVHIAPYRHPLVTAHQFATVDYLSKGRLIMGVGIGWEVDEYRALAANFEKKGKVTEESIEIYKRAWLDDTINFHGEFFTIENITMDPKPWQKPRPPIIFGATTEIGARRAARTSDGLYTVHLDPYPGVQVWRSAKEAALREGEKHGKDMSEFWYGSFCSCLPTGPEHPLAKQAQRPTLTGSKDQILSELAEFAEEGYGHITLHMHCQSGKIEELFELSQKFAEEILPDAKRIQPKPFA